jgi:signal transduction histidine kinase
MVQIVDDGAGVVDEEDFRYDMESVYKRSKMINAALNIENKPGEKLKVMLRIPLQN